MSVLKDKDNAEKEEDNDTNANEEAVTMHVRNGASKNRDIRLRRLFHERSFANPLLANDLEGLGIEADYSTLCRIAWEQVYAVHGVSMSDEMATSVLKQLENPDEDWNLVFLPNVVGIQTKRDYRIKHAGLTALELRLSGVVLKLLEIFGGGDDNVHIGGSVFFDIESMMIQAASDGVEYKFWFCMHEESCQYFVSDVEVDAAFMGVDLKWSGNSDDVLSVLADCLSGERVWEDLEPTVKTPCSVTEAPKTPESD